MQEIINYFEGVKNRIELREKMHQGLPDGYSKNKLEILFKQIQAQGKDIADSELTAKCIDYKQQTQKYQDTNRIERKTFRQDSRVSNALEEYNKALIENFTNLRPFTIVHEEFNNKAVGVIQLSDIHFNELINIEGNQYDFKIASKRLKLLCAKAKMYFSNMDISNVLVAFTGDILNNDKLLDKLLNQATNRAKATLLGFHILEQFICDLNQSFNISIASVTGNEGRANIELGYSNIMATDNYDFTIFNMLKIAFRGNKGINFIEGNGSEQIINIANNNILLLHGLSIKNEIEKSIQSMIGKYATKGIIIDYVFIGHIHSARIGDLYARSSSLCGANAYSDYALNLASRASQNIGIFYDNKSHDVFKIDLQNTDNIQGYPIISKLEEYNAKSIEKCNKDTVIFKVVI
jgi:predicted phosphodiesterase